MLIYKQEPFPTGLRNVVIQPYSIQTSARLDIFHIKPDDEKSHLHSTIITCDRSLRSDFWERLAKYERLMSLLGVDDFLQSCMSLSLGGCMDSLQYGSVVEYLTSICATTRLGQSAHTHSHTYKHTFLQIFRKVSFPQFYMLQNKIVMK